MDRITALDAQYADATTALAKVRARADEITRTLAKNPTNSEVLAQLRAARADIDEAREQINALDEIREEVAALDEADRVTAWAKAQENTIAEINRSAEARIKELAKPIDDAIAQLSDALRAWESEGERISALTTRTALSRQKDPNYSAALIGLIRGYAKGEISNAVIRGVMNALSAIPTHGMIEYPGMITGPGHTSTVEDCARVSAENLRHHLRA